MICANRNEKNGNVLNCPISALMLFRGRRCRVYYLINADLVKQVYIDKIAKGKISGKQFG